jgi:hypothetical protein
VETLEDRWLLTNMTGGPNITYGTPLSATRLDLTASVPRHCFQNAFCSKINVIPPAGWEFPKETTHGTPL